MIFYNFDFIGSLRPVLRVPHDYFLDVIFVQNTVMTSGAEHGEGVTDPETVFDGAARGDVNYVHFCLEANGEIITASHGAEGSSLLHVAGNTGNTDLAKVSGMSRSAIARERERIIRAFRLLKIFPPVLKSF